MPSDSPSSPTQRSQPKVAAASTRHARAAGGRQHGVAVVGVLLEEAVVAGHADHARGYALALQLLGRLEAGGHLRPGADQDQLGPGLLALSRST